MTQETDEQLAKKVLTAIRRQRLMTKTGWFPFGRMATFWSKAGFSTGMDRGIDYCVSVGWLEKHPQTTHIRISDIGQTV